MKSKNYLFALLSVALVFGVSSCDLSDSHSEEYDPDYPFVSYDLAIFMLDGGDTTIYYNFTVSEAWAIDELEQDWLSVDQMEGEAGVVQLTISVDKNSSETMSRDAFVNIVASTGEALLVYVEQAAGSIDVSSQEEGVVATITDANSGESVNITGVTHKALGDEKVEVVFKTESGDDINFYLYHKVESGEVETGYYSARSSIDDIEDPFYTPETGYMYVNSSVLFTNENPMNIQVTRDGDEYKYAVYYYGINYEGNSTSFSFTTTPQIIATEVKAVVGDCYPSADSPIGVVCLVNPYDYSNGYVSSLDEASRTWGSSSAKYTQWVDDYYDGRKNMATLYALNGGSFSSNPAFLWVDAKNNGVTKDYASDALNVWFLPSFRELSQILLNKDAVNSTLSSISGATTLKSTFRSLYITSSESNDDGYSTQATILFIEFSYDYVTTYAADKTYSAYVRAMMEVEF